MLQQLSAGRPQQLSTLRGQQDMPPQLKQSMLGQQADATAAVYNFALILLPEGTSS